MGGAGGFFPGRADPEELFRKLRDSESKTKNEKFETEVGKHISDFLVKYNERGEEVKKHLDAIKKALEKDIEGTIDLLFGGSVAKHTYVDGLSDIDALVIINKSELTKKSPEEVKDYLLDTLNTRLSKTPIDKGPLAVTVNYQDIPIQLLPALKYKGGLRIADSSGKNWSFIKPTTFMEQLTKTNQKMGGKLIPTIKIAKSINSSLPEDRQLESYHTEALSIKVFQKYDGPKTPKAMLKHFFCNAGACIKKPIKDVTEQSTYVDGYLGGKGSLKRKIVADSIDRIGRRMQNADGALSTKQWTEILGGL